MEKINEKDLDQLISIMNYLRYLNTKPDVEFSELVKGADKLIDITDNLLPKIFKDNDMNYINNEFMDIWDSDVFQEFINKYCSKLKEENPEHFHAHSSVINLLLDEYTREDLFGNKWGQHRIYKFIK